MYICNVDIANMENLLLLSQQKIQRTSLNFSRYLLNQIDLNQRLIAIKGARGVGKTTLLLQLAKRYGDNTSVAYVAMDDLFFNDTKLYDFASDFSKHGGKVLLLDEVHKYPNWSREIKLIYDNFQDLKIIFTSSSILEIFKSESDLSRRLISYNLNELSFREFLEFERGITVPLLSLEDIILKHNQIVLDLLADFKPIMHFKNYLNYGCYPYFKEKKEFYHQKLMQTINLIIEVDLLTVQHIDYAHITKIKRLLYVLASSVPFVPNVSKLSESTNMSRASLINSLENLKKSCLIDYLQKNKEGIAALRKPDKLYLRNTNLIFALAESNANIGNLRETFFLNQLSFNNTVRLAEKGDFIVNSEFTFEVGGKNKSKAQISGIENAFVVKDDIEIGINKTIPLWLFGLMY